RVDPRFLVLADERSSLSLPGVRLLERRRHGGSLELGRELRAEVTEELDALGVSEERAARREVSEVLFDRGGARVARVRLAAERPVLFEREIARAALGRSARVRDRVGWRERLSAFRRERRREDVRGRVQVARRVTAHELAILREGDVALDD